MCVKNALNSAMETKLSFKNADEPSTLSESEYKQVIVEWNSTKAPYSSTLCIHNMFEKQVELNPDAIAVEFEKEKLSYRDLNKRSNQLADYLIAQDIGPGDYVGIYVSRSIEMIIALIGILKAGAAYVPLDIQHPIKRSQYIIASLSIRYIVTLNKHLSESIDLLSGDNNHQPLMKPLDLNQVTQKVISLDPVPPLNNSLLINNLCIDINSLAKFSARNPDIETNSENNAYVIFTSGTTGNPKGVQVKHKPVINLIEWVNKSFNVGSEDRLLFVTALNFDLSVYDVFGVLAAGGTVCIANENNIKNPEALLNELIDRRITFWDSAPAPLQQLEPYMQDINASADKNNLRLVFMSGDWVPLNLPPVLKKTFPNASVVALGGATEATIWSNFFVIDKIDSSWKSIPYGKPISNARYYILDNELRPCPIGVSGDLYIGGDCLANGYVNDPELTKEKFIEDPFSNDSNARLYKTGDLARFFPDGNIEFLGRTDYQVKIRGYRIELGDIEHGLNSLDQVKQAIVIALERKVNDKYLVAYICPVGEFNQLALTRQLKTLLPKYMIPSYFVAVKTIPITANGKIDRKALQALALFDRAKSATKSSLTDTEYKLARIWSDVLAIDAKQLNKDDDFFALGGDSLLCIKMIAKARQQGILINAEHFYRNPTIVSSARSQNENSIPLIPAGSHTLHGKVPLTIGQRWFFSENFEEPHRWNIRVLYRLEKQLDPELVEKSLQYLLSHHDGLRARFEKTINGWRSTIDAKCNNRFFSKIDLSKIPTEKQREEIERETNRLDASFNLNKGPLLRVVVFKLGNNQPDYLLFLIHHLIADWQSLPILLEDFQTVYTQFSLSQDAALPAKTASVEQIGKQIESYAGSIEFQQELQAYWLKLPWEKTAKLPVDFSCGDNTTTSCDVVHQKLPRDKTEILLRVLPRREGIEMINTLLCALSDTISDWTDKEYVQFKVLNSARGRVSYLKNVDLSRSVGFFVLPQHVVFKCDKNNDHIKELHSIKHQYSSAPNGGFGISVLLNTSQNIPIKKRLERNIHDDITFNYLGSLSVNKLDVSEYLHPQGEIISRGIDVANKRKDILNLTAYIDEHGQLNMEWEYSENIHMFSTIENVANQYSERLIELANFLEKPFQPVSNIENSKQ